MRSQVSEIHHRATQAAAYFKQAQSELIACLLEMDSVQGYRDLKCASLFEYATRELALTEDVACTLIRIARKSKEVPELKQLIDEGRISVTQAKLLAPVLDPVNKVELLERAQSLSKRELEREIAHHFPERAVNERARYVAPERIKLELGVSPELMKQLERIRDLESQRTGKPVSFEGALEAMAELFLEKKDPVRKAERVTPKPVSPAPGRIKLPAAVIHEVNKRDQGRCTHVSNGKKCESRRWLDIHHVVPLSIGGTNDASNLTTRCSAHHRALHLRTHS